MPLSQAVVTTVFCPLGTTTSNGAACGNDWPAGDRRVRR
jgi:hypothetical protein